MNDRDRLIELLHNAPGHRNWELDYDAFEQMSDYLIANGVTIQKHGRQFAYRCPECNSSVTDFSKREKPRLFPF